MTPTRSSFLSFILQPHYLIRYVVIAALCVGVAIVYDTVPKWIYFAIGFVGAAMLNTMFVIWRNSRKELVVKTFGDMLKDIEWKEQQRKVDAVLDDILQDEVKPASGILSPNVSVRVYDNGVVYSAPTANLTGAASYRPSTTHTIRVLDYLDILPPVPKTALVDSGSSATVVSANQKEEFATLSYKKLDQVINDAMNAIPEKEMYIITENLRKAMAKDYTKKEMDLLYGVTLSNQIALASPDTGVSMDYEPAGIIKLSCRYGNPVGLGLMDKMTLDDVPELPTPDIEGTGVEEEGEVLVHHTGNIHYSGNLPKLQFTYSVESPKEEVPELPTPDIEGTGIVAEEMTSDLLEVQMADAKFTAKHLYSTKDLRPMLPTPEISYYQDETNLLLTRRDGVWTVVDRLEDASTGPWYLGLFRTLSSGKLLPMELGR